ncbi:MBL fold metallo-hydrolase [Citrobacter freundii]|uniref:MBL fold metallo-hydrolase n=2 Tax=Citrobacter TaxID=544 RepID=UPI002017F20B|nr:MBL fold metallo-hydrolase [Citrobacter freundii]
MAIAMSVSGLVAGVPVFNAAAQSTVQQEAQVPGFYRYQVGDAVVTAVYDGYINLSTSLLKGIEAKDIQTLLAKMFQEEGKEGVQTAVNAYLVKMNNELVLIDSGAAKCFGPTMGNIVDNIRAAGYKPEDVKTVLLTHMHPDHICGLITADGKAAFPNATVVVSQDEKDFWLNPKIAAAASDEHKPFFKMAQDSVAPYQARGAFRTFKSGENVIPGIDSLATPGHTPGHASFMLKSAGKEMLIWGDIVHAHAVQFANPKVSIEFDTDSKKAVATRKATFEKAAKEKWLVAGAHLPFPGIGHIRHDAQGYAWVPVEYAPLVEKK